MCCALCSNSIQLNIAFLFKFSLASIVIFCASTAVYTFLIPSTKASTNHKITADLPKRDEIRHSAVFFSSSVYCYFIKKKTPTLKCMCNDFSFHFTSLLEHINVIVTAVVTFFVIESTSVRSQQKARILFTNLQFRHHNNNDAASLYVYVISRAFLFRCPFQRSNIPFSWSLNGPTVRFILNNIFAFSIFVFGGDCCCCCRSYRFCFYCCFCCNKPFSLSAILISRKLLHNCSFVFDHALNRFSLSIYIKTRQRTTTSTSDIWRFRQMLRNAE